MRSAWPTSHVKIVVPSSSLQIPIALHASARSRRDQRSSQARCDTEYCDFFKVAPMSTMADWRRKMRRRLAQQRGGMNYTRHMVAKARKKGKHRDKGVQRRRRGTIGELV